MTVSPLPIRRLAVVAVLAIAVVLSACSDDPVPTPEPTATPTTAPPATPTNTPTPTPTATPTPAPTPTAQLTAAEVYSLVSPSIPFIETPTGTGSGILIEGGYVITNYHVVWPYETVRVVFPDDKVLQNVPVVGWDSMADLAVLGPVDVPARPSKLGDGEDLAPGSELFLVGYPAEMDEFPEPTITRGILSRFREWERLGMTYLQTDAAIAGGQSGGALVNSLGEVIGISTFSFSEAGFGLATSAADNAPIVERLIQGDLTSELGHRRLPAGGVAFEFYVELANFWDSRTFVLDATAGTILQAEIDGPGDGLLRVSAPFGLLIEVDDGETGIESGAVELPVDGIHFVQVEMASGESSTFDLTSTIRLKPFHDPDDGRTIAIGETVAGNIDFHSDWDWYSIHLEEGETVTISTDSINVDTLLYVDFPNSRDDQVVSDDDSGGGLFGINSELVYRAPNTGEYFIVVTDAVGDSFGGYYLSVEQAREGTETVHVPTGPQLVEGQVVESPFGEMLVFEGPAGYFEVQTPQIWIEGEPDPTEYEVFWASNPEGNGGIIINVKEGVLVSLTEAADEFGSGLLEGGAESYEFWEIETTQGHPAVLLEFDGSELAGTTLIYLSDGGKAIIITYVFPAAQFDAGRELAHYSFGTFRVRVDLDLDLDSLWQGVFDAFTPSEQMCIRNELGEELLASVLGLPILGEGDTEQWKVSIYECLDPETAATLYLSIVIASIEGQGLDLDEENEACLRELLTDTDVAGIAAATLPDASPEGAAMVEDFQGKLLTCLAGLLLPDDGGPAAGPPPPDDSLIWQYDTGTEGELVIVSPTVIEGVVYAGSYENRVYALDAETGELLWSFETESDLSPPPLVAGGAVFVEDLANLYALDASTGDLLWSEKSALGGSNHAALVSDGIVYIPTSPRDDDFSVSAVDAVSGEQLWATKMPRSGFPLFFPLTAAGSNVYVSDDHRVHALDSTIEKLVWTLDAGDPVTAPPTASNGAVFLRSYTTAYALDESTGEELWSHEVDSAESDFPPVVVDDVWYLNDSSLRALDAATGQLLWSFEADKEKADLRQAATGQPAVAGGMVFVRTEYLYEKTDAFHALNAATGDEVWCIDDDSGLTSIMVVDEVLYAHSLDGYLHTLDARTGEPIWSIAIGYHWWRYPYAVSAGVVYVGYQNADSGGIYALLASGNSNTR